MENFEAKTSKSFSMSTIQRRKWTHHFKNSGLGKRYFHFYEIQHINRKKRHIHLIPNLWFRIYRWGATTWKILKLSLLNNFPCQQFNIENEHTTWKILACVKDFFIFSKFNISTGKTDIYISSPNFYLEFIGVKKPLGKFLS